MPAIPAVTTAQRGAFVTVLDGGGALRGCIGRIAGDHPLGEVIRRMAVAAARDDPRFAPLSATELTAVRIEISVLSEPVRMAPVDPGRVVIGRDGLLVRRGGAQGVLLPQVAADHGWPAEAFLAAACEKAGLPAGAWREPDTEVFTFHADVFRETGEGGRGKGEG